MPVTAYPITIDDETAEVSTAAELVVALDVLHGQHDRAVLEQLRPHLAEILAGPTGLFAALRALEPDDQAYLIDALGPDLARLVERPGVLRDILATLAHADVEERLLATLGADGLRTLIRTPEELSGVLEWVYGGRDGVVLDLLGHEFLTRLFQTGRELSVVLKAIDTARQEQLLDSLGWDHVAALVIDEQDLAYLMRALPAGLSKRLVDHLPPERLRNVVPDQHAWQSLSRFLEADEAAYLRERMEADTHAQ
jgi:hypothetical protein